MHLRRSRALGFQWRNLLLAIAFAVPAVAAAQSSELPLKRTPKPTKPEISADDLMTRLYIFADDSMEGRAYGKPGNLKGTAYLAAEMAKLGLEPAGDSGTYFQTLPGTTSRNVVAILRGSDPKLNQTYVAIGAHNDHVGFARTAIADHDSVRAFKVARERLRRTVTDKAVLDSLIRAIVVNVDSLRKLRPARRDSINNGADDDGSGSVAVLEIAEALAKLKVKPKRSILFVFHTGEEGGMIGSRHFLKNPTIPRDSIIAQVNMDMVGRGSLEDTPEGGPNMLMVVGANRIAPELGKTVEAVNKTHKLRLDYTWDAPNHPQSIYSRSDHYAYAQQGIPVVFFFTGLHVDYHQVTDEPQYIDYQHMEKIAKYGYDLMLALGSRPTPLKSPAAATP